MGLYSAQMTAGVKIALLPYSLSLNLIRSKPQRKGQFVVQRPVALSSPQMTEPALNLSAGTFLGAWGPQRGAIPPPNCDLTTILTSLALNLQKPLSSSFFWALITPRLGGQWRVVCSEEWCSPAFCNRTLSHWDLKAGGFVSLTETTSELSSCQWPHFAHFSQSFDGAEVTSPSPPAVQTESGSIFCIWRKKTPQPSLRLSQTTSSGPP